MVQAVDSDPGRSPFTRRTVRLVALVIAALLVLGGLLGLLTRSSPHPLGTSTRTTLALPSGSVPASLPRLMGLLSLPGTPAPALGLRAGNGSTAGLTAERGKVVLVTFLDAACTGICPVELAELRDATRDLGALARDVVVVVVNVDPSRLTPASLGTLSKRSALGATKVLVETGSLTALRRVWSAYGVQVEVDQTTGTVLYSPRIFFIDPYGRERYLATPYGTEQADGKTVLSGALTVEWGEGIARYAKALLSGSSQ